VTVLREPAALLAGRPGPRPLLRLRVWLTHGALDRRLAAGDDPASSSPLRMRARQLTSPQIRASVAANVLATVDQAEQPRRGLTAAVPVCGRTVRAARAELIALAHELTSDRPVWAQGVALTIQLLVDAESPVFQPGGDLPGAIRTAREALDGRVG
jgi:hypothetical protein